MLVETIAVNLFVLLVFLTLAVLVYWAGPRYGGWSKKRTYVTSGAFVLMALLGSGYSFWVTAELERITLFEARVQGNLGALEGSPVITRDVSFWVEHANSPHRLIVHPRLGMGEQATFTARLKVRLSTSMHRLLDAEAVFEPQERRRHHDHDAGPAYSRYEWEAASFEFIPKDIGDHRLEVDFLVADTPDVLIRVEDPLKTDGRRVPGLR